MSYNSKYKGAEVEAKLEKVDQLNAGMEDTDETAEDVSLLLAKQMVNHGTADTTFTLTPNTFHVWDAVTSLTLTLGEEIEGVTNEYLFQFTSGATATTLSLPDTIKWPNGEGLSIEANKVYQLSILNGMASVLTYEA